MRTPTPLPAAARPAGVLLALAFCTGSALGHHPAVPFPELVHSADVIFVGTVSKMESKVGAQPGWFSTDVTFTGIQLIHKRDSVLVDVAESITLNFAGGKVGERGLDVCSVPRFVQGQRYLILTRMDGQPYLSPVIGGTQGALRLIRDTQDDKLYPLTLNGAGIAAVTGGQLELVPGVDRVAGGLAARRPNILDMAPAPRSARGDAEPALSRPVPPSAPVLSLDELINLIHATLQSPPPAERVLRGVDGAYQVAVEGLAAEALARADATQQSARRLDGLTPAGPVFELEFPADDVLPTQCDGQQEDGEPIGGGDPFAPSGPGDGNDDPVPVAPLCYCGYHNLNLVMEQVPEDWWSWTHNNDSMWQWNQFMDVYRYVPSDGKVGNNTDNEFCGWMDDNTLNDIWGRKWNGALAVCFTSWVWCECCEIIESDIVFNPAYSWWEDLDDTFGKSGRVLYRPVVMHELGHSWGMQRGECVEDYNYDRPSVMHAYYSGIVEDGWGLHGVDAWAIRRLYDDQKSWITRKDVGVESYYASGSLKNTSTDKSSYYPGDAITINNMTVENMSSAATAGVRFRFYLSVNDIISEGDHRMGGWWGWDSLARETWWTGDISTTVPDVPPGTYYVGIIVTVDGGSYNSDDLSFNNATYLAKTIEVLCPPQSAPTGVSASDGTYTDKVRITWNAASCAEEYRVYRNTSNDSGGAVAISNWIAATSFDDTAATPGDTYYYWVRARNDCGSVSGFSSSNAGWRKLSPPSTLTASDGTYTDRVYVDWNTSSGASHYRLYRGLTNDPNVAAP